MCCGDTTELSMRAGMEMINGRHTTRALRARILSTILHALGDSVHRAFGPAFSNGVSLGVGSSVHCVASGDLFGDWKVCRYPM